MGKKKDVATISSGVSLWSVICSRRPVEERVPLVGPALPIGAVIGHPSSALRLQSSAS
jgi:hypothetical protein